MEEEFELNHDMLTFLCTAAHASSSQPLHNSHNYVVEDFKQNDCHCEAPLCLVTTLLFVVLSTAIRFGYPAIDLSGWLSNVGRRVGVVNAIDNANKTPDMAAWQ